MLHEKTLFISTYYCTHTPPYINSDLARNAGLCLRMRTCWGLRELEREVFILWQVKGDLGWGWRVVRQSERYRPPRTSMDPVELEMGLKRGRENLHKRMRKTYRSQRQISQNVENCLYCKAWNQAFFGASGWVESMNAIPVVLPQHLIIQLHGISAE